MHVHQFGNATMPRHPRCEQVAISHFALIVMIEQRGHTEISPSSNELCEPRSSAAYT
jgi:hypothetical protein